MSRYTMPPRTGVAYLGQSRPDPRSRGADLVNRYFARHLVGWVEAEGGSAGAVVDRHITLGLLGAVGAAVEPALHLGAVADHLAAAVLADRCHQVHRALEAVEGVGGSRRRHLEALVVVVAADLADRHDVSLPESFQGPVGCGPDALDA